MFVVSETAGDELRRTLDEVPPHTGYRLFEVEGQYTLRLDRPNERDRIIENGDRMVLMLDPEVDQMLAGVVLDLQEDQKLTLRALPSQDLD